MYAHLLVLGIIGATVASPAAPPLQGTLVQQMVLQETLEVAGSTELLEITGVELMQEVVGDGLLIDREVKLELIEVADQGPPGPPGPAGSGLVLTVGTTPLSGHTLVVVDANGLLAAADATDPEHVGRLTGMVENAYSAGAPAAVVAGGIVNHAGWTFTPQALLYAGVNGQLTQTLPPGASWAQTVGYALTATRVLLALQPPIALT
jgi:hypothetical protein